MKIDIVTLFPGIFNGPLTESIIKRAQHKKLVDIEITDLRDFTSDKHRTADDKPYGGGCGMVLKPEPIFKSVKALCRAKTKLILMSPKGFVFDQKIAKELSLEKHLLFICGHYEGVDERIRIGLKPLEISIGDYILTNGSLAAMVVIDALVRLIPGVLGNVDSNISESFNEGLLEYPHYTRPRVYKRMKVPQELLSGNHKLIEKWRKKQSLKCTKEKRPDLLIKKGI